MAAIHIYKSSVSIIFRDSRGVLNNVIEGDKENPPVSSEIEDSGFKKTIKNLTSIRLYILIPIQGIFHFSKYIAKSTDFTDSASKMCQAHRMHASDKTRARDPNSPPWVAVSTRKIIIYVSISIESAVFQAKCICATIAAISSQRR